MHEYPHHRVDDTGTLADGEWRLETNPDDSIVLVTGPGVLLQDGAPMLTDIMTNHFMSCRVCISIALHSLGLTSSPDKADDLARLLGEAAEHRRAPADPEIAAPRTSSDRACSNPAAC